MADTPQNIQLRRFVRPIGVTGLGTTQTGRTARRMRTLGDSFDGVLATGVSPGAGAPLADLSYLTLAPLVAQGLMRDERDRGAALTASTESIPSDADDDSGPDAPEGDERRVRELLDDDGDVATDNRDQRLADMTVSEDQRRTLDDESGDENRSERRSGGTGRSDRHSPLIRRGGQDSHRGGDGPGELSDWNQEASVNDPPRTVVEQSAHDVERSESERPLSDPGDSQASSPADEPGPVQGSDSPSMQGPSDVVPTTVVHHGVRGSDKSGPGTRPGTDAGTGVHTPGNGHGGPSLTVTGPGMTEMSTETDAASPSEPNGTHRQFRPTDPQREEASAEAVTERTVIRSDGRLNERVFDRLYEEVSRKMRLERDREGR